MREVSRPQQLRRVSRTVPSDSHSFIFQNYAQCSMVLMRVPLRRVIVEQIKQLRQHS